MNPADLLGTTFACQCGKTHAVPIRAVVYSEQAVAQLPALLSSHLPGQRIVLIADERTWPLAGQPCQERLMQAGWRVTEFILPDGPHGSPVCDDVTRNALVNRLPLPQRHGPPRAQRRSLPPCDGFLAVGSGTVSDLVKWLACDRRLPYAMVATAASMNGYASNNIAPAIRGVKRVLNGAVPRIILADPAVISQAPYELTAAGFGDVLAKPVSMADWKLNQLLFGEYFCPVCAQLIRDLEPGYLAHPETILARDPAAMEALFQALIYSGISMTMAGTSFPASGGEHLISHALDMTAMARGLKHDYHGRQVGLGTIFACALYERVLALEAPEFQCDLEPTDRRFWTTLTDIVEEEHVLKRKKAELAIRQLKQPGTWDRVRTTLAPALRKAGEIRQALRAAGAACRIEDIGCSREHFLSAALHCHQLRERYTIIDLARAAGILPGAAREIIEEYL